MIKVPYMVNTEDLVERCNFKNFIYISCKSIEGEMKVLQQHIKHSNTSKIIYFTSIRISKLFDNIPSAFSVLYPIAVIKSLQVIRFRT